jgi:DME family drug/metabolite transporter
MLIGLVLISLAAISWGTTGATMTLLAREASMSPLLVGWARLAIAAPCLLAGAALAAIARPTGGHRSAVEASLWRARNLGPLLAGGVAMAGYQVCYFSAVPLTGVAVTALLAICSAPVLIAFLAATLLGERLTPILLACLALAVAGTALLVLGSHGPGQISGHFGFGSLLAVGAGLCYAVYAVAAKGLLSRLRPLTVAAAVFTLGAVLLSPVALGAGLLPQLRPAALVLLLYLGIGPTAIAYALFSAGLRRVPVAVAGIVTLLEPLTATTLGISVFGESLGAQGMAGAALLLLALGILMMAEPGARTQKPPETTG